MKINNIFSRFLQVLVLSGSAIFTTKTAVAEPSKINDDKTIDDRINLVREHFRSQPNNNDLAAAGPRHIENPPLDQIWINIVPNWNDWNKLWNDWANWNNWSKWNDWNNFHRDHDWDHHDRGHHDHDRGHDHDHDRGKDHKR